MAGVYQIVNVFTGQTYIGSSVDISRRWADHVKQLNECTHCNPGLQSDWLIYGQDGFCFQALERVRPKKLLEREQVWIDSYPAGSLYNLKKARAAKTKKRGGLSWLEQVLGQL